MASNVEITDPKRLPADWREVYEERAAIMEYDGGLPRKVAEVEALRLVLQEMRNGRH